MTSGIGFEILHAFGARLAEAAYLESDKESVTESQHPGISLIVEKKLLRPRTIKFCALSSKRYGTESRA